jgi:hypothetical protein
MDLETPVNDDNVTTLPGTEALPENPLQIAPRPSSWCNHGFIIIDDHTRTITCADSKCGAVLDAFNYLRSNAHTISTAWQNYRHVSNQAKEINERVHQLKKEEQRLRAMIKRLQEKSGAVLNVRGGKDL